MKVIKTIRNPDRILIKVFKGAIHEFLIFACMLAEQENNYSFYKELYL